MGDPVRRRGQVTDHDAGERGQARLPGPREQARSDEAQGPDDTQPMVPWPAGRRRDNEHSAAAHCVTSTALNARAMTTSPTRRLHRPAHLAARRALTPRLPVHRTQPDQRDPLER